VYNIVRTGYIKQISRLSPRWAGLSEAK